MLAMKIFNTKRTQAELFQKKLAAFKAHYKSEFDISPDDEIFYMIIRMNEMQLAITKEIKGIDQVRFNNRWDYFMYALGSSLKYFWIILAALILSFGIVYYTDHKISYHEMNHSGAIQTKDSVKSKKVAK